MRYILFSLFLMSVFFVQAQHTHFFPYLGDEYLGYSYLGTSASYTRSWNNEAPNPDAHNELGWTAKIDIRTVNWAPGSLKYYFQYKMLGDVLTILDNRLMGDGSKYSRHQESILSNGILGWHSIGWTAWSNEQISLAPAFNLNDYFFGSSYKMDSVSNELRSPEPQGYFFAAGPAVLIDWKFSRFALLHLHAAYSFSYWRAVSLSYAEEDNGYPKPHFYQFSAEVLSPWGVFLGLDYNAVVNRGNLPNNTKRIDLLLGFRWVL